MLQERHQPHQLQELHAVTSATLLSAQQVQDLLDVDASTIYRMAADGRLPGVRIGRQWRFRAADIQALLEPVSDEVDATTRVSAATRGAGPAQVPADVATALLETLAPALGVTMVVTDLDGRPLTPVVHPAPAIAARLGDPDFATTCAAEWRAFAHEPHLAPRLRPSGFGFLCAHGVVRHGASLIAMVLAGGIAPDGDADADATDSDGLFHLDAHQRAEVLEALPRAAALLSLVATPDPSPAPIQPGPD